MDTHILKDIKSHSDLLNELENALNINQNLIVEINNDVAINFKTLTNYAKIFKKKNHSFVVVIENIDYNAIPDTINVVPTIQEAKDIIELETIERELGF